MSRGMDSPGRSEKHSPLAELAEATGRARTVVYDSAVDGPPTPGEQGA